MALNVNTMLTDSGGGSKLSSVASAAASAPAKAAASAASKAAATAQPKNPTAASTPAVVKTGGTNYKDSTPSTGSSTGSGSGGGSGGGGYSGYSGGGGEVSYWSGSSSKKSSAPWTEGIVDDPELVKNLYNADAAAQVNQELMKASGLEEGPAKIGRVEHIDTHPEEEMLQQITDAARQQAELQVNNAVQTGTTQLQRNMEDAQDQYQQARNQIDVEEQRALDNQALYAEARGDRGGIGMAQYNSIQNTAATNRLTVQNEQTKLATDTARQIADLRSQGEFEKANQLLSITQNYLGQLMNLYQWAKETNLGVDQFNIQVDEWEENYKLSLLGANLDIANATGVFANGTPTSATWQNTQKLLAAAGQALLEQGIAPTTEQLAAMGMTAGQAESYKTKKYRK